jgi:hypothetical protein
MSTTVSGYYLEPAVLDAMVPTLEADGFLVIIHPRQDVLPTFMQGYRPDMVAYKENKNLAIEITGRSRAAPDSTLKERALRA